MSGTGTGVGIGNWRDHPHSRWSFQHVRWIMPTAQIKADRPANTPPACVADDGLFSLPCKTASGAVPLANLLQRGDCDGLRVLHHGRPVGEWSAPWFNASLPHILFSVSKSLTGLLAGILAGGGGIDPDQPVTRYVNGFGDSVYANCTLRHLLDMTVSLAFEENYTDPLSEYVRYRHATGWNPVDQRHPGPALEGFLRTLKGTGEGHGESFLYRSPNSDMLGLVIEHAAAMPLAEAFSHLLWQPMGASDNGDLTVDREGSGRAAGGICVTLRDLARLGQLVLEHGASGSRQVIPESWIVDTWSGGSRDAWLRGNYRHKLPDGRYRNQWYQAGNADNCLHARGIHGQLLYINPARQVVIARLSSQPEPLNDALTADMIGAFDRVAASLGDAV